MREAVEGYLAELEAQTYAPSRRRSARWALERLVAYLAEREGVQDWREVGEGQLRAFVVWAGGTYRTARGERLAASTLGVWVSLVRSFFEWMGERGELVGNAAERLERPRTGPGLARALSEEAIGRMLEQPDVATARGLRDRALMELLYATGLRLSEVWRLELSDVELGEGRLVVCEGKGRRDRVVPLTERARHWVGRYVSQARVELALGPMGGRGGRRRPSAAPTWALWVGSRGGRLSQVAIGQIVRRYGRKAGLKASPHTIRHSFATHLLLGGASVRHVQMLLGHASLDTTAGYTHLDVEDLRRALEEASRKGGLGGGAAVVDSGA